MKNVVTERVEIERKQEAKQGIPARSVPLPMSTESSTEEASSSSRPRRVQSLPH